MRTKKASCKNKRASWQLAVQEQGHGGIRKLARGIRKLARGIRKLEVVFGNWDSETGIRKVESGIRKLNFGNAKVVFGNSKMVFGNWYSETGNPVFGNWELYSETGKRYSETGSCIQTLFFGNWNPGIGKLLRYNHRTLMLIFHHPLSSSMAIPHEEKLKLRSSSIGQKRWQF